VARAGDVDGEVEGDVDSGVACDGRTAVAVGARRRHDLTMEPDDMEPDDMEPDEVDPNAISPMTDEEADLFRRLRFGPMPPPVRPVDMVAEVDTRHLQPDDLAELERRNWQYPG
jgi:hypothetical protein